MQPEQCPIEEFAYGAFLGWPLHEHEHKHIEDVHAPSKPLSSGTVMNLELHGSDGTSGRIPERGSGKMFEGLSTALSCRVWAQPCNESSIDRASRRPGNSSATISHL